MIGKENKQVIQQEKKKKKRRVRLAPISGARAGT